MLNNYKNFTLNIIHIFICRYTYNCIKVGAEGVYDSNFSFICELFSFLRILILIFYLLWRLTDIQIVFGLIKSLSNFPWKWTLTHPNWLLKTTLILKVCLYYLFFWYIPKMVSPFIFPFFRWFLCKRIQYSQLIKILFFILYYLYFFKKTDIYF